MKFSGSSTIVLALVLLGGCSGGVQSQSLSRSTALTLLSRWDHIGNDQKVEIAYPVERVIDPLNDPGQGRINQLEKAFWIDDPVKAGVLTIKSAEPYSDAGHPVGSTKFTLALVPQPGVAWAKNYTYLAGTINVQLAVRTVKEVTGVRQEGTSAVVDVVMVTKPTQLYEKMKDATKNELAICSNSTNRLQLDYCPGLLGSLWPADDTLSNTQSRQVDFIRYDDGWRIEGWDH